MDTRGIIAYSGRDVARPRYYANQHDRGLLHMAPTEMDIYSARGLETSLDREGFVLLNHHSVVQDFTDATHVNTGHRDEIIKLIGQVSGADQVVVSSPGILRFSEKSELSGQLNNSRPARFAHVDISSRTAQEFAQRAAPPNSKLRRFAHYNVWRVISQPPQDVPLALCDARSVSQDDLIAADAIFDAPGQPEWSFEGLVVAHNPNHRWLWYPDMNPTEVIVFKTNDSDPNCARCVPHVAFDDQRCGPNVAPRSSLEMRALALWFA
jgi:hypothetical protein